MDTKKLFEYEYLLESLRPELTEAEMVNTLKNPDLLNAQDVAKIASFNVTPSDDGIYVKFTDENGAQQKMAFLNPVVARSLVSTLLHNLSAQGYIEDDTVEFDEVDTHTIH